MARFHQANRMVRRGTGKEQGSEEAIIQLASAKSNVYSDKHLFMRYFKGCKNIISEVKPTQSFFRICTALFEPVCATSQDFTALESHSGFSLSVDQIKLNRHSADTDAM